MPTPFTHLATVPELLAHPGLSAGLAAALTAELPAFLLGNIAPDTVFPKGDFRNVYFKGDRKQDVHAHTEALKPLLDGEASTLPELALRFCLSQDAVSTVIPGMRRISSVESNIGVSDGRRLSPRRLEQLRAHAWRRNFYS